MLNASHHVDVQEATSQAQKLAEIAELVDRGLCIRLRAVLVTAPPCSDGYTADWRPQTQRRYSCGSPWQGVFWNFLMFFGLRRLRKYRLGHFARLPETRTKCECASSPDLGILNQVQKVSRIQNGAFAAPIHQDCRLQSLPCPCGLWASLRHRNFLAERTASTAARQNSWATST